MKASLRYGVVYKHRYTYPIAVMCSFFGVSRSGYYAWCKRSKQPDRDITVGELIKECQASTNNTYGYRRVKMWLLKRTGLIINHKALLRLMNKYGLLARIRRRRKYIVSDEQIHRYKNLLNREFEADKPNQKWVTDITYIKTGQGTLFLSAIKDLYDGFIVSYKIGTEQTINLVTSTVKEALKMQKAADGLALHSDQGFQYTSTAYRSLSQSYSFKPSMSRKGNPIDNAPMESFFGTLKVECIHKAKPRTYDEARSLISDYINFYNYERIQLKTMLTPYEKRCQHA